ncbi:MAG: D-alanyl-D-alanine carboxypeptidase [Bacteroidota bacterium]|nr:D-alanyl-D-alanine carboxypeptidase [Bacteroidota bacterium]
MNRLIHIAIICTLIFSFSACHHKEKHTAISPPHHDTTSLKHADLAQQDSLIQGLDHMIKDRCFDGATIGYIVMDFTKGMPVTIAEHNAKKGMVPASTQKIFITGAALELFGNSVAQEVTVTNQFSINWRANRLLQKIGEKMYGKKDYIHGTRAVMDFWTSRGLDLSGVNLVDGSGRSHDNCLTPHQLADLLYKMTTSHYFPIFYNSLPLAGISGTMHRWLKGTDGERRVRAKTGSLDKVRSYAGYVHTVTGKRLIFAVIVNDYNCRTKVLKSKMEDVLVRMAEL